MSMEGGGTGTRNPDRHLPHFYMASHVLLSAENGMFVSSDSGLIILVLLLWLPRSFQARRGAGGPRSEPISQTWRQLEGRRARPANWRGPRHEPAVAFSKTSTTNTQCI